MTPLGFPNWRPIWYATKWPLSLHRAAQPHSRQGQQPRRFRLFSIPLATLSKWGSSLASIGRAATSPASPTCTWRLQQNGLESCAKLLPNAARFAVLVNPNSQNAKSEITEAQEAGSAIARQIDILTASTGREIDVAFASLVQKRTDALVVGPHSFFRNRRAQLLSLAARHAVPTIFSYRDDAEAGGLMSYGSTFDEYHQLGIYVGRILKGERPADLPVIQASKFEFIINLQTAKALGIDIPSTLLAIADEVIE